MTALLVLIGIVVTLTICLSIVTRLIPPPPSGYKAPPPPPPSPGSSPPPGSPPPTPAPAPAATARTYWSWVWMVIALAAVLAVGWWAMNYQTRKSTPVASKTSAPAAFPQKTGERAIRVSLVPVSGKAEIKKGECVRFEFDNSPPSEISVKRYQVVFTAYSTPGAEHHLEIEGQPETFHFRHSNAPGIPEQIIFFSNGKAGEPRLFHPGKVRLKLWSDGEIRIMNPQVEFIYSG